MFVQGFQEPMVCLPARAVFDHADLLPDDPLLFLHTLFGKVRHRNEAKQSPKIFPEAFGTLKMIACNGCAGERIRRCPGR